MEVSKGKIETELIKRGFEPSVHNVLRVQDGLEWEDREDYDTTEDAIQNVIEDYEHDLARRMAIGTLGKLKHKGG